jgi:sulfoxide reductase heme-binding subunit YedZ
MAVQYKAVLWNRQKKRYDLALWGLMLGYLALFTGFHFVFHPEVSPEALIIRGTSTLALIMLHVILLIGPLSRLNPQFLPLLYNRRHLGVSMFLMALVHAIVSIVQFHALGETQPLVSIFVSNTHYASVSQFPFQTLGFFALLILFLMAATSHDFWLKNLSPRIWKTLHMLVYVAYALIIMHVMLGVVQAESSPVLVGLLGLGVIGVVGTHIAAGTKEVRAAKPIKREELDGFVEVCDIEEIQDDRAKVFIIRSENIAVFKYDNKLSAINNVCKHQNGPLGEGKVVDGCVTCPWHGYQYLPENGQSPPPFKEKVATYAVKLLGTRVWINPTPHPEGTPLPPAVIQ